MVTEPSLSQLIRLCDAYVGLGFAVQEQLRNSAEVAGAWQDCNPNALGLIRRWLEKAAKYCEEAGGLLEEIDEPKP